MATRTKCPNCKSGSKGRSLYRCADCRFIGCIKTGVFSTEGCWKKNECPRCGSEKKAEHFGYIGDYDGN